MTKAKKLSFTFEVSVVAIDQENFDLVGINPEDDEDKQLLDPASYTAFEIAECVKGAFYEDGIREMFAGSDVFVTIDEESVILKEAKWVT